MSSDDVSNDVLDLDAVSVLLHELLDRERLVFGAPLPETTATVDAFALRRSVCSDTPEQETPVVRPEGSQQP